MNWQMKLTVEEQQHVLRDACSHTLAEFKATRSAQKQFIAHHSGVECPICRDIAVKLGIEEN